MTRDGEVALIGRVGIDRVEAGFGQLAEAVGDKGRDRQPVRLGVARGGGHGARVYVRHHHVLRAADFRGIDAHRPRAAAQIEHAPARLRRIQLQHRPRAAIQPARRKQSLRLRKNDGNASNGLGNHGFLLYTYVLKTAAPPAEAGSVGGGREGNAAQTAVAKPFKRFSVVSLSA